MSVVTDVILLTSRYDGCTVDQIATHPNVDIVNKYLENNERDRQLYQVDQYSHNGHSMQCDVWIGAFNYFNIENFIQAIKDVEWVNRECVQLLIKDEEEDIFKIITL